MAKHSRGNVIHSI